MNEPNDKILIEQINNSDVKAFEILFHRYYNILCLYAAKIVKEDTAAEEIIQNLFVKLWEKREKIEIKTSVKNYLVRSVKNQCLNLIKHNKLKEAHAKLLIDSENKPDTEEYYIEIDLIKKIEESINSLPEKRREVFRLSREEGLKYREIAEKLGISIKTVETHIGLAIKTLRDKLKNYNTFFILICIFIKE